MLDPTINSDTTTTDGTTTMNNTNLDDNMITNYNTTLQSYQQQSNFISLHYVMRGAFGNENCQHDYDSSDNHKYDDEVFVMRIVRR